MPIWPTCPTTLKKAIAKAFVDAPQKDKDAFAKLSDGKDLGFVEVTAKDYEELVKMNLWLDEQRKKKPPEPICRAAVLLWPPPSYAVCPPPAA